jgi:hypothetical protein
MTKVKEHSDDAYPLRYEQPEPETVPNPNARNQSASGYPSRWPK